MTNSADLLRELRIDRRNDTAPEPRPKARLVALFAALLAIGAGSGP